MALRSLAVDGCAGRYLRRHPQATVVALAEGFQTSFWRLGEAVPDPQFRWVSVDLPPVIELRRRLLPSSPRITDAGAVRARLQLDGPGGQRQRGVHHRRRPADVSAARRGDGLIAQCAKRFPGGQMFFDLPPVLVKKTRPEGDASHRGTTGCRRCRSASASDQLADLVNTVPGIKAVHDIPMPRGRGFFFNTLFPAVCGLRSDEALPRRVHPAGVRLTPHRTPSRDTAAPRACPARAPGRPHVGVGRGGHRGVGRIGPGHESPESATGFDDPGGLQLPVGARHGVDRQAQLTGQLAHRRQPGARWQPPSREPVDDLRPELIKQWPDRLRVDAHPIPQLRHVLSIALRPAILVDVRIAVLSGAGISAESGVPTFRDDETGLWAKYDPYELSSADGWQSQPEKVWAWYLWRHHLMSRCSPTTATARWRPGRTTPTSRGHPERRQSARAGRQQARAPPARQPVRILVRSLPIRYPGDCPTCPNRSPSRCRRSVSAAG